MPYTCTGQVCTCLDGCAGFPGPFAPLNQGLSKDFNTQSLLTQAFMATPNARVCIDTTYTQPECIKVKTPTKKKAVPVPVQNVMLKCGKSMQNKNTNTLLLRYKALTHSLL
jgi:hypothetical protein